MGREVGHAFIMESKCLNKYSVKKLRIISNLPIGLETYASPDVLQRRKESKESGWVSNFQISEEEKIPKRPTSSYSVSKSPSRSTGNKFEFNTYLLQLIFYLSLHCVFIHCFMFIHIRRVEKSQ